MTRRAAVLGAALALAGCAGNVRPYSGPAVTRIETFKGKRTLRLLSGSRELKRYGIGLGFKPDGHKLYEGDGRTPEGLYYIDRRNPESRYHLSIGISYPNAQDRARAAAVGKSPGGNIFIHGRGKHYRKSQRDWTWGCIAVKDAEMEEIYAMVRDGTPIFIYP